MLPLDVGQRCRTNGCDGACANAPYDETLDFNSGEKCEAHAYATPPTSSEGSASDTSSEGTS